MYGTTRRSDYSSQHYITFLWPRATTVWKGRRQRYDRGVIRRALPRVLRKAGTRRVRVTADRGLPT
jgi:hypothetical protein